ncbi:hypothetical protein M378DRAFT_88899, partial [Amanita muscaria Koide BX008]
AFLALPVTDSLGCPHCGYSASAKVIRKHMNEKHRGEDNSGRLETVQVQVLNTGQSKTYFRVIVVEEEVVVEKPTFVQEMESFHLSPTNAPREIPNARLVSPWLLRTGWHTYVNGHDPTILHNLVSIPKQGEMEGLQAAILKYFNSATDLIDKTDELVLQKINTADPDKEGINNTPLHRHHQHESTIKAYIIPILHLLAALLRPSPSFSFPTSDTLYNALTDLSKDLADQQSLHAVFMALWKTTWRTTQDVKMPDPTICFLALFCMKVDGSFFHPKDITGPIAKLCRAIQLAMLTELHSLVNFAYNSMSLPQIWWTDRDSWQTLLYHGQQITLAHVQKVFQTLEEKIVLLWEEGVLLGKKIHVSYGELADNLLKSDTGYCFLDDDNNPFKSHMFDLGREILEDKLTCIVAGTNTTELDIVACRKWLYSLAELESLLMLSVDLKGGAPARGTELTSMLIRNTSFRMRNTMGLGKHLSIVRQYDKTTNLSQNDKLIPHAIDSLDADILIQLHTLARPLAQFLASKVFPGKPEIVNNYSNMMFMDFGKEFTSEQLSKIMGSTMRPVVGWNVTISSWRHINIAWKRKLCKGLADISEQTSGHAIHALQSGHSVANENRIYGLSPEAFLGASEDVMQLFLDASIEWQVVNKVVPGGLGLSYTESRMSKFDDLVMSGVIKASKPSPQALPPLPAAVDKPETLQVMQETILKAIQGLSGQVQQLQKEVLELKQMSGQGHKEIPVAPATELTGQQHRSSSTRIWLKDSRRQQDLSQEIPRPIQQSAVRQDTLDQIATPLPTSSPSPEPVSNCFIRPPTFIPLKRMLHGSHSMKTQLRKLYGPNANWTCQQQREAVKALMALQQDVIVALRTGIGKTAIAILPSMVESGYTVIIIPLVALMEDWKRRLTEMEIPFEHFKGQETRSLNGNANIILVSSDAAKYDHWKKFVVDEAHYYFTDINFRGHALQNPFAIRILPVQMVLMSGTIPPKAVDYLKSQFVLHNALVIKTHSSRLEIEYLREKPASHLDEMVVRFQGYLAKYKQKEKWNDETDRFLIFTPFIEDGMNIAKKMGIEFYHGSKKQPLTAEQKQGIYERWVRGEHEGMVASTALGAGNDYGHVRIAAHLGTPYDMVTFAQQTGRAGRDGEPAVSYLVPKGKIQGRNGEDTADLAGKEAMQKYVQGRISYPTGCFRYQLSEFLDGKGYTCYDFGDDAELCTICDESCELIYCLKCRVRLKVVGS